MSIYKDIDIDRTQMNTARERYREEFAFDWRSDLEEWAFDMNRKIEEWAEQVKAESQLLSAEHMEFILYVEKLVPRGW